MDTATAIPEYNSKDRCSLELTSETGERAYVSQLAGV